MRFDSGTRTRILADMTLDFDPTGSTLEILVDGTAYPATWLGSPATATVSGKAQWTQTGQTTSYFAGPSVAVPAGAVVLTAGPHSFETRVTSGADIIESQSGASRITVSD